MSDIMRAYGMYCKDLTPKSIAWLTAKNVHPDVLGWDNGGFAIKAATVKWEGGQWFDFDPFGPWALIIACRDERGDVADLCAWSPADGVAALWLGHVAMLGEEAVLRPRADGDKLWVWPSPMEWLVHRRVGVVVLSPERARPLLVAGSPLAVLTRQHKAALDELWQPPRVQVFDMDGLAAIITEAA
jgi:hypothetical protein